MRPSQLNRFLSTELLRPTTLPCRSRGVATNVAHFLQHHGWVNRLLGKGLGGARSLLLWIHEPIYSTQRAHNTLQQHNIHSGCILIPHPNVYNNYSECTTSAYI